MKTIALALASALTLAVLPAAAQSIYKFVRPDGSVVYSDKPVAGAKLDERLEPAQPPDPAAVAAAQEAARKRARAVNESAAERTQAVSAVDAEIRAATDALAQARARLEAGREPLPGERTGIVATGSGRSRLNGDYWARQIDNEQAVAEAQSRLDAAFAARNALR
jgi:acyl-CoA reductase-like NAD-dependent aldehyde dehydrogenase